MEPGKSDDAHLIQDDGDVPIPPPDNLLGRRRYEDVATVIVLDDREL